LVKPVPADHGRRPSKPDSSFVLNGEAVLLGVDGRSDFNGLHSRRHACLLGLEGRVSKHRESIYRGGRSDHWIKVKNRQHPAVSRVQDQF
jgi:ATP-dependent DNA ligase